MRTTGVRVAAAIPGLLMLVSGIGWITDPASAAEGLGMPLLDGIGRSTQIGDFASFFLGIGAMVLIGVWTLRTEWLLAAAVLLGGAAVMRTVAFVAHDAPFATTFVAVEVVLPGILVVSPIAPSRARSETRAA